MGLLRRRWVGEAQKSFSLSSPQCWAIHDLSPLDPAPRRYTAEVSLIRRSARGPASAPAETTPEAIEAWLFDGAMRENDMLTLFEELAWRLAAAGLPVDRLTLHVGTLHPQIR